MIPANIRNPVALQRVPRDPLTVSVKIPKIQHLKVEPRNYCMNYGVCKLLLCALLCCGVLWDGRKAAAAMQCSLRKTENKKSIEEN